MKKGLTKVDSLRLGTLSALLSIHVIAGPGVCSYSDVKPFAV